MEHDQEDSETFFQSAFLQLFCFILFVFSYLEILYQLLYS